VKKYRITKEDHPCETPGCRNIVTPGCRTKLCGKCKNRQFKEKNPHRYDFGNLRRRAKKRGHEFSLTFEQYTEFAKKTGFFEQKGKTARSLSINRIDNKKGYHVDNIEAVTLSWNSRLQWSDCPAWYRDQIIAESQKKGELCQSTQ